jgi:hypothetical protein
LNHVHDKLAPAQQAEAAATLSFESNPPGLARATIEFDGVSDMRLHLQISPLISATDSLISRRICSIMAPHGIMLRYLKLEVGIMPNKRGVHGTVFQELQRGCS